MSKKPDGESIKLNELLCSKIFDKAYKEYRQELAGISYMATGLTVNVIKYEKDRKEAVRNLIRKLIESV